MYFFYKIQQQINKYIKLINGQATSPRLVFERTIFIKFVYNMCCSGYFFRNNIYNIIMYLLDLLICWAEH